ncbi:MAG: Leucine-rich repeat (LRR) protein, partial [Bacillariaceae sp.]
QSSIEILNVSKNAIGGDDFPSRFQSSALTTVDFSFNNLNSTFNLSSLTGLVNIQNIHMASCSIQSSLPDDISVLQSLVTIDLDSNVFLEGTIPSSIGDISTLQKILLASNSLSGTIPVELAQLENLTILELQFNSLSGTIPTEFDELTGLEIFNITGNNITENNITAGNSV